VRLTDPWLSFAVRNALWHPPPEVSVTNVVPPESLDTAFVIGRSAVDCCTAEDEQPGNANAKAAAAVMASALPVTGPDVLTS
jgi:hypothetical protein